MPPRAHRRLKCCYREGARRCPRDGAGNPPLCPAHQIAVQEASRPRRPSEVIAQAVVNFLQGKPINVEATIGAADTLIGQGIGVGYPPDDPDGNGHARPRFVPPWWTAANPSPRPPPPPDPRVEARRAELAARQVLGFAASEPLTADLIKDRKKRLARRYHPDHGGSDAKMQGINAAADVLMESL